MYKKILLEHMVGNAMLRISNMRGPRDMIYIDAIPVLDIACLGATMTTGIFFSSYMDNLTICYTYGDVVNGPHERLMRYLPQAIEKYLSIL
jgi:hypothetical protein